MMPDCTACNTVIGSIRYGRYPGRTKPAGRLQIRACNVRSKPAMAENPALLVEFPGREAGVDEQLELFSQIAGRQIARCSHRAIATDGTRP
jgi:hypothetical protein